MDSQSMFRLAQRVMAAPSTSARVHEIVSLAPADTLARLGLAHRRSALGTATVTVAIFSAGAAIGAAAALLLTPMSGRELQATVRRRAKRVSKDVRRRAARMEEQASDALDAYVAHEPLDKPNGPAA